VEETKALRAEAGGELTEGVAPGERDPRQARWNFGALVFDVSFFAVGLSCLDLSAVLPLLLEKLGASRPLIGAFAAARFLAFAVVQVFVAYALVGRARQKPFLFVSAGLTRLPLIVLPFLLWRADASEANRQIALVATILCYSIWALGDGLGYVPWMEIVARAFSARTRGRFFATTQLLSGLANIAIAFFVVRNVLGAEGLPYPQNYAVLAAAAALMFQISTVGIWLIREPPAPPITHPPRLPLTAYFRRLPALVLGNPTFARLAVIQLLVGFGSAAAPFYVLYATHRFGLSDVWGGTYQVMLAISVAALMPVWTLLSERFGSAMAVRGVALACLLTPVAAFTLGTFSPWFYGLVFLLMGGSLGWGMWIALNHFLLTHIAEEERPIYVALLNLLFAPSAVYPIIGGLLVQKQTFLSVGGIPILFLLTAGVILIGFLLTLRLPAPATR
jgi:MFS family permease